MRPALTLLFVSQAHGMLPHMGAGAGQGLEDAYLLVRLLSHPKTTIENIEVCRWCLYSSQWLTVIRRRF